MLRETGGDHSIGRVVLRWLSAENVDDVEIGFALRATLEKLPTDSVQEALRPVDRNLGVVAKSKLAQHTLRRVVLESGDPDKSPQVELEASEL